MRSRARQKPGLSLCAAGAVPLIPAAQTLHFAGCEITLREVAGERGRELFLACLPSRQLDDPVDQAASVYRGVRELLAGRGGDAGCITLETLHLACVDDAAAVREAREAVLGIDGETLPAAMVEVVQPPPIPGARFALSLQAIVPAGASAQQRDTIAITTRCNCAACQRTAGTLLRQGERNEFFTGAIYGSGDDAGAQARCMFETALEMLGAAGMDFSNVVRTWIYLSEMQRDYPQLNQARREFFRAQAINPAPASTGIGATLVSPQHDLCMAFYACKGATDARVMSTPTLNEAQSYGADFSRGIRVVGHGGDALFVSGTASLDENGISLYAGDPAAQAGRTLLNISELLRAQGANFSHIVAATTYIKRAGDLDTIVAEQRAAGFSGFPHAMVLAPVCRPELLCETEVLARLPGANY